MMPVDTLLLASIEDNIGWSSTVCASHQCEERNSASTWANFAPSPPFYPNIITRRRNSQAEVCRLVKDVRQNGMMGAWGIKDSFGDLDLANQGFDLAIEGQWFGGEPTTGQKIRHDWETAHGPEELSLWEEAWGGKSDRRIFKDTLLADHRIRFWMLREAGDIIAGLISFSSGPAIGLSNWFSKQDGTVFDLGVPSILARPIVCWAPTTDPTPTGLSPLGPLRVWISSL
jgi:hypothetical protein